MKKTDIINSLCHLFCQWSQLEVDKVEALPPAGSERRYFRLQAGELSALGAYNSNDAENRAFIRFSENMAAMGIPTPAVYAQDLDAGIYLVEDLGHQSLLAALEQDRQINGGGVGATIVEAYRKALKNLARLQVKGIDEIDFSYCYPNSRFDARTMRWDCNQFKYWYLQAIYCPYDEAALEDDFEALCAYLAEAPADFFMFRDFQARNIMMRKETPYFIDYQGAKKGPLQYDLASLLFQAKANLPQDLREELLQYYLDELTLWLPNINRVEFEAYYYGFVLLRSMQVLGAYGFKGHYQGKAHFKASIPYALSNLRWLLSTKGLPLQLAQLQQVLEYISSSEQDKKTEGFIPQEQFPEGGKSILQINISSFSYHQGLPEDNSEHGAGFIFDCRPIHNPGRYLPYKTLSGLDIPVKLFLEQGGEMSEFLISVKRLTENAVEKYLRRGFEHLGIHFGCTGGQHRSVYAAEAMKQWLEERFGERVKVDMIHRERARWPLATQKI